MSPGTSKEARKLWPPSILFEAARDEGERYRDAVDVAHETIEWILANHRPERLSKEVSQELSRIVAAADQDEELKRELLGE